MDSAASETDPRRLLAETRSALGSARELLDEAAEEMVDPCDDWYGPWAASANLGCVGVVAVSRAYSSCSSMGFGGE